MGGYSQDAFGGGYGSRGNNLYSDPGPFGSDSAGFGGNGYMGSPTYQQDYRSGLGGSGMGYGQNVPVRAR